MILLSFDIEEFDVPLEQGIRIPLEQQIAVSSEGTRKIIACLHKHDIRATFFCTAHFALHAPDVMQQIVAEGHEIASHGYNHSSFDVQDLKRSRETLEAITGQSIRGFRMPRMMPVDKKELCRAGYTYDSSLNPTCIPGRYNHLHRPRTWFYEETLLQIPSSVTPFGRFPLFWLSCHNLPEWLYFRMFQWTLNHDGYAATYFHPWEFTDLKRNSQAWKLPFVMTNHSGEALLGRLERLILFLKNKGGAFSTYSHFIANRCTKSFKQ